MSPDEMLSELKKGDRVRATWRRPEDFVPAPGCRKACCRLEWTEVLTVRQVQRKRRRLQMGGAFVSVDSPHLVALERAEEPAPGPGDNGGFLGTSLRAARGENV